ncbi:hypothetical protein [Mycolicibacterium komossense]|uniref:Tape measure protein n=1 Tax=Mycolicibacterium komossense TaxID=1779 RepID=A0ABT3CAL0_9MYCO|nr:hypothetical protein [Mycolicibacterium komossense]MCV7226522.1 hypothetical protein [Mycolicibacterium komossense]
MSGSGGVKLRMFADDSQQSANQESTEGIPAIAIHLDVLLRLQDRQLRSDTDKLERDLKSDFERIGTNAGAAQGKAHGDAYARTLSPRLKKATKDAADAADLIAVKEADLFAARTTSEGISRRYAQTESELAQRRRENVRDIGAETKLENDLMKARIASANVLKQVAKIEADRNSASRKLGDAQRTVQDLTPAVSGVESLGTALSGLSKFAMPGAVLALAPALVQVVGVATAASQAIWLLPAAAGAAGAAFGTIALATHGFSDAIDSMSDPKKFAAALNNLSPNAQKAAITLKSLVAGPIKDLREATQDSFFAGIGPELQKLSTTLLPSVQGMTTTIAGVFNQMFQGIGNQLMTPETGAALSQTMSNIGAAFQAAAPAAQSMTRAITDIMAVGSSALAPLATSISNAASEFARFIQSASASGQLQSWLAGGISAFQQLSGVAGNFISAFGKLAPIGEESLPAIVDALNTVAEMLPTIASVATNAGNGFETWAGPLQLVKVIFDGLDTQVGRVATQIPAATNPLRVISNIANSIRWLLDPNYRDSQSPEALAQQKLDDALTRAGMQLPGAAPGAATGPGNPAADRWLTADNAAHPPSANGLPAGTYRRRDGSIGYAPTPSMQDAIPTSLGGPNGSYNPSGGGSASERDKIRAGLNPADYLPAGMPTAAPGGGGLLANVPSGHYVDPGGTFDLSQGLADCSSAVGDLVKEMDGLPMGGADRLNTGNAATWLPAHGFLPNNTGANIPGAMNVGYDPAHMQATLPDGTPFNWGSDVAAANRGIGGTGAFDPAFTSHYYRPGGSTYGAPGYVDQSAVTEARQDVWKSGYNLQQSRMDEAVLGKDPTATGLEKSAAHEKVIEDGWAYQKALDKLSEAQQGTWKKLSDSANQYSNGMQQIGATLDSDFGVSKGLPGIFENLTKMLGGLAMAPVVGALSGVTAAYGTAGPGSGLLGMLAPRTNANGQQMPNILGQYPDAKDGQPGARPAGIAPSDTVPAMLTPGEFVVPKGPAQHFGPELEQIRGYDKGGRVVGDVNSAPKPAATRPAAPAPGMPGGPPIAPMAPPGAPGGIGGPGGPPGGPLPGPADQKAGGTATRDTAQRGITQGEGLPASDGIGFSGGIIGAAESAAASGAGAFPGGAAAAAGAQIGIDEINRAIGFGAQAAGIGVEGLMQTFLPVESELADPMRGWFGKILGGVAGIRPAAKNVAGGLTDKILGKGPDKGQDPLTAQQVADNSTTQNNNQSSVTNHNTIDYHASAAQSQDANFAAFSEHVANQNAMPGQR